MQYALKARVVLAGEAICRNRKALAVVFGVCLARIKSLTRQDMLRTGAVAEQMLGSAASA